MKFKLWLLIVLAGALLYGCTTLSTTTFSIENKLPRKIEQQLNEVQFKENTGLKLFSNNKDIYYIIYDTTKEVEGFPGVWETEVNGVILKIVHGKELNEPTRYVYKIRRKPLYDTIEIEKNGLPSSFDVRGSY